MPSRSLENPSTGEPGLRKKRIQNISALSSVFIKELVVVVVEPHNSDALIPIVSPLGSTMHLSYCFICHLAF
jgi:hypothetical protein